MVAFEGSVEEEDPRKNTEKEGKDKEVRVKTGESDITEQGKETQESEHILAESIYKKNRNMSGWMWHLEGHC